MTKLLSELAGMPVPVKSAIDGTCADVEHAQDILHAWGLKLSDLVLDSGIDIREYLRRPREYDFGLKDLEVGALGENNTLKATVVIQHKRYLSQKLSFLAGLLDSVGLLPKQTIYDNPECYKAHAAIR